jgi:3-polyprenyl-4-hydroxybenzoate decarboxylase
MVDHTVGRLADLFGLDTGGVKRWLGPPSGRGRRKLED